jgi:putative hydrolase of the HAD superfamily
VTNGQTAADRRVAPARTIIFDGDDTLWDTQTIFKAVLGEFYTRLADQGFDRAEGLDRFTRINQALLDQIKLSTDRLGRAMSATYQALCGEQHRTPDPAFSRSLVDLAQQVYARMPEPLPGLETVLAGLAERYELVFYSAGDDTTQRSRLRGLGLEPLFRDRVHVVQQKDDATLRDVLKRRELDPATTWIVGNSPRFELNPGLRLGLSAIWMYTNFWKFDLEDIAEVRTHVAFTLTEAGNIVQYGSPTGPDTQAPAVEVAALGEAVPRSVDPSRVWLVGTSPRYDLNPALQAGCTVVWLPSGFSTADIEPIRGVVYVAFTTEGARRIVDLRTGTEHEPVRVVFRSGGGSGDLGGSMVVE